MAAHAKASHYCFQLRKCVNEECAYCVFNPVRDPELYDRVSFLPEPTPDDSGNHYLPFEEVYIINSTNLSKNKQ